MVHRYRPAAPHTVIISILALMFMVAPVSAEPSAEPVKEWTFMIFMNADSNLTGYDESDMQEMQRVGSSESVNIVTQVDRAKDEGASRYHIQKNDRYVFDQEVLEDLGEVNMGDPAVMVDFVRWAVAQYPARRYMLVLWNHGSGWKLRSGAPFYKGISYDETDHDHITTPELGTAMQEIRRIIGRNLDVLGFDACLMQMAEIVHEVMGTVDYVLASEEVETGTGWQYELIFKELMKDPFMKTEDFLAPLPKIFTGLHFFNSTTMSVVRAREMHHLGRTVANLAYRLREDPESAETIQTAVSGVQRFYDPDFADLYHLVELIKSASTNTGVIEAADEVLGTKEAVVAASSHRGYKVPNARGISLYLPEASRYREDYRDLVFARATGWADFLEYCFENGLDEPEDRAESKTRHPADYHPADNRHISELISRIEDETPDSQLIYARVLRRANEYLSNVLLTADNHRMRAETEQLLTRINTLLNRFKYPD